jgi:hypothetical protein
LYGSQNTTLLLLLQIISHSVLLSSGFELGVTCSEKKPFLKHYKTHGCPFKGIKKNIFLSEHSEEC